MEKITALTDLPGGTLLGDDYDGSDRWWPKGETVVVPDNRNGWWQPVWEAQWLPFGCDEAHVNRFGATVVVEEYVPDYTPEFGDEYAYEAIVTAASPVTPNVVRAYRTTDEARQAAAKLRRRLAADVEALWPCGRWVIEVSDRDGQTAGVCTVNGPGTVPDDDEDAER